MRYYLFTPLLLSALTGCAARAQGTPWRTTLDEYEIFAYVSADVARSGSSEATALLDYCEDPRVCTILPLQKPGSIAITQSDAWFPFVPLAVGHTTVTRFVRGTLRATHQEVIVEAPPDRDALAVSRPLPTTDSARLAQPPSIYRSAGGYAPARCWSVGSASHGDRISGLDRPDTHLFFCAAAREILPGVFRWLSRGYLADINGGISREFFACARSDGRVVTALTLLVDPEATGTYRIASTQGSSTPVCQPVKPIQVAQ